MNKTLILVVEDDRPIRNLIVTTLKMHKRVSLMSSTSNGFLFKNCYYCSILGNNLQGSSHHLKAKRQRKGFIYE